MPVRARHACPSQARHSGLRRNDAVGEVFASRALPFVQDVQGAPVCRHIPLAHGYGTIDTSSIAKEHPMAHVSLNMVTTANELPGYRIVRPMGIVRGITVRSRSIVGNLGAALQTLVGGNISTYTELCEKAREEAFELMLQHAGQHGANAVVAMRYDANDVAEGVTEVLAYGTAVQVEPLA